jgi:hypothetical protein
MHAQRPPSPLILPQKVPVYHIRGANMARASSLLKRHQVGNLPVRLKLAHLPVRGAHSASYRPLVSRSRAAPRLAGPHATLPKKLPYRGRRRIPTAMRASQACCAQACRGEQLRRRLAVSRATIAKVAKRAAEGTQTARSVMNVVARYRNGASRYRAPGSR